MSGPSNTILWPGGWRFFLRALAIHAHGMGGVLAAWLVCLAGLLCSNPATAQGSAIATAQAARITSLHHLVESDGPLDLQAVQARSDWRPHQKMLSLGFGPQGFWVRLRLVDLVPGQRVVIRVRPSFLDQVDIHLPQAHGEIRPVRLGDLQALSRQDFADPALAVDWTPPPGMEKAEILVRVQSTSTRAFDVEVITPMEAQWRRSLESGALGLFFGLMLFLLVWGVLHALADRDAVWAWYAAYQGSAILMSIGLLGYARVLLPVGLSVSPDLWTSLAILVMPTMAGLFHLQFLRSMVGRGGVPLSIRIVLAVCIGAGLFNLALYALGWRWQALAVNAKVVLVAAAGLCLTVVVYALRRPQSPLRSILLAYAAQCVLVLLTLLPLLGLIQAGAWMQYSTSVHTLLVALVLGAMLLARRSQARKEAQGVRDDLRAEQARVQQVLAERDEKDRFLSMLTHELRTPLSVIRMVLEGVRRREATASGQRQVDLARGAVVDIDQVIERTVMVDRLERRVLEARVALCELAEIVRISCAASEQAARVRLSLPPSPLFVSGDPVLLRVMVGNLLDNALKYSPPGTAVDITVAPQGRGAVMRCCNPPGRAGRPDPQRVFGKYYRSQGAQHSSGSGQGLYLVEGLARQMGLQVRCEPGRHDRPQDPVCFELIWEERHDAPVDPDPGGP